MTVDYSTKTGTANSDDFEETSGTLRFKAGKTKKTVRVALINDEVEEPTESMKLKLSSAHGAVISRAKATGTIDDDDAPPNLADFCRLEFPPTLTLQAGAQSGEIFGRVGEPGLTDNPSTNDPSITSQVGYGPDGSDPATDPGWVFATAASNAAYMIGSPNFEAANDEHSGSFTAPNSSGEYDLAFRFSLDGGINYVYCDTGAAGSSDGYSAVNAGQMTVTPAP